MVSSTKWNSALKTSISPDMVDTFDPKQGMTTDSIIKWTTRTLSKQEYQTPLNSVPNLKPDKSSDKPTETINSANSNYFSPPINHSNSNIYNPSVRSTTKGSGDHKYNTKIDTPNKPTPHFEINFVPRS